MAAARDWRVRWMAHASCLALVLSLLLVAGSPLGLAADAQAVPMVAIGDILSRADHDERFANRVLAHTSSSTQLDRLQNRLAVIERAVNEAGTGLSLGQINGLPVIRLEGLDRNWQFEAKRFAKWQQDASQLASSVSKDAAELARMQGQWEELLRPENARGIPPALATRAREVIEALQHVSRELSSVLAAHIALGEHASAVESRIQAWRETVGGAIAAFDARLLRVEAAPLWSVGQAENAIPPPSGGLDLELRFAQEYSQQQGASRTLLAVWQLLLATVLIWLAVRNRKTAIDDESWASSALRALQRPVSAWMLLCMFGVLILEPDAPLLAHQVVMIFVAIPAVRLLPRGRFGVPLSWATAAAALYLLGGFAFFFVDAGSTYRMYLLALTLAALAIVLVMLWRDRTYAHTPRVRQVIRSMAWAAIAVLTLSTISNVLGNVTLAETLSLGLVDSVYFALLLYAGATVLAALLQVVLTRSSTGERGHRAIEVPPWVRPIMLALGLAGIAGWCVYAMQAFRIYRPASAIANEILTYEVPLGTISITPGHVLVFVAAVALTFWSAGMVRASLRDGVLTRVPLPRGVGNSVSSLAYYAVLLLGLLLALSAAGVPLGQLTLLFGALGVGIGFGLQNVVNNFVSGLILMLERPIQPGDVVEIGGASGRVREIGMRATSIRTFDGADVVVPNGTVLSENLINWTLRDRNRRIEVTVGVAYGSSPAEVIAVLCEAARGTSGIHAEPAPTALLTGFGPSSLDFSLRAWTHDLDHWPAIRSELLTRVDSLLKAHGIRIPFPQHDVHIIEAPTGTPLTSGNRSENPPSPSPPEADR